MKDEFDDTQKLSLENSSSVLLTFPLNKLGFVKSRVRLCGCDWTKLAVEGATAIVGAGGVRVKVCVCGELPEAAADADADEDEGEE